MGRLGVPLDLWPAFLEEVNRFPNVEVEGILSHYSMADETDEPLHSETVGGLQERP